MRKKDKTMLGAIGATAVVTGAMMSMRSQSKLDKATRNAKKARNKIMDMM